MNSDRANPYTTPAELPATAGARTWLYYLPEIVWVTTAIVASSLACHFYLGLQEAEAEAARAIRTLKARESRVEELERYYGNLLNPKS